MVGPLPIQSLFQLFHFVQVVHQVLEHRIIDRVGNDHGIGCLAHLGPGQDKFTFFRPISQGWEAASHRAWGNWAGPPTRR